MKQLMAPILAAALALSASATFAGGPVIVEEEVEVVAENSSSSVGILPIILIGVVLCLVICGDDEQPN